MSRMYTCAPTPITPGDSSNIMLEAALGELRLSGPAHDLFGRFPSLLLAALRLTWHITAELASPRSGRPILNHCLEAAIDKATTAKRAGANVRGAFLQALLANACMLMEIDVRSGAERWDPLVDDPLSVWYPERSHARVDPRPSREVPLRSPVTFLAGLALRLLEPSDISELSLNMGAQVLIA